MHMCNQRKIGTLVGLAIGSAVAVGVGVFLMRRFGIPFQVKELVSVVEELKKKTLKTTKKRKVKKISKLIAAKKGKAHDLLKAMKTKIAYTQVQLQQMTKIPYRSIRRYIEVLAKENKVQVTGYGKGRKFLKV